MVFKFTLLSALMLPFMILADRGAVQMLEDFSACDESRLVTLDSTHEIIDYNKGKALKVTFGFEKPWPNISLKGNWDLSAFTCVEVDITNPGRDAVKLGCRVDNPGANGNTNMSTGKLSVEPGATATIRVEFNRKSPFGFQELLPGMHGYPDGTKKGAVLDPSKVVAVQFFGFRPSSEQTLIIDNIRATGSFSQKAFEEAVPEKFMPFIDAMGQYRHKTWNGKINKIEDLAVSCQAEEAELSASPAVPGRNRFGGWSEGPQLKATGAFRTERYKDRWWLVDPEGRLFWSFGPCCVRMDTSTFVEERDGWFENLPPESGDPLSQFYHKAKCVRGDYKGREMTAFDFGGANLYRRYGAEWEKHSVDLAHRRLQSWGMNTLGCWSADEVIKCSRTPFVHWVYNAPRNIRAWGITVKPFPDFFDPGFEKTFERRAQNMAGRYKDDPLCIGFFSDNELCWGTVTTAGRLALKAPADQPAKVRMIAMLREKYGDVSKLNQVWKTQFADWEAFDQPVIPPDAARRDMEEYCRLTAEHYFSVCSRVLHRVAPKKLYLGCRFAEYNAIVVEAANRYCDVVSFNLYSTTVKAWAPPAALTRPVLIGEFHFGAPDRGPFGSGLVGVENQRERAAALTQYVEGALQNPLIIGAHWFQYRDEPASGRTLEGENHQIGLVDICDTPCPETIEAVRNVTRRMYSLRADVR